MGVLHVGRKENFRDGRAPDARIGKFIADQFVEFLADAFGDSFVAMRVQALEYQADLILLSLRSRVDSEAKWLFAPIVVRKFKEDFARSAEPRWRQRLLRVQDTRNRDMLSLKPRPDLRSRDSKRMWRAPFVMR